MHKLLHKTWSSSSIFCPPFSVLSIKVAKKQSCNYIQTPVYTSVPFTWKRLSSSGRCFSNLVSSSALVFEACQTPDWPRNTFLWCPWQQDVFIHRNRGKKAHNNSTTNINTLKYIGVLCNLSPWHAVRSFRVKPAPHPSRPRASRETSASDSPRPLGWRPNWSTLTGLTPSHSALIKGPHRYSNLLTWIWVPGQRNRPLTLAGADKLMSCNVRPEV